MSDFRHYAPACERNREPIAEVLARALPEPASVLEVGCGTGEHAEHFTRVLPHLTWLPTDVPGTLTSARAWHTWAARENFRWPVELDTTVEWPHETFDAVFSANMIHYAPWKVVIGFFEGVGRVLREGGILFVYGPYRYADRPLEPSNVRFDAWLKNREPDAGVRLFDDVDALARAQGLELVDDVAMPANNRCIWWARR